MCVPVPVPAQSQEHLGSILTVLGASSEEELDGQEMERFQHYLAHPLEINIASRSRLLSSGLLSQYQVASLEDYRSRSGDVLSFTELSAVEGFGEDYVAAVKPFLSLRSLTLPGQPALDSLVIRHDLLARTGFKGGASNYGTKYKLSFGEVASASLAARTSYSDIRMFPPSSWSFNVTVAGKRHLGKAVFGDYNLRVGQGLSLWSGMSLSGFSSSSSWSWSGIGSHRGAAADFQFGRFMLTGFLSFPGLRTRMEGSRKDGIGIMPGTTLGWFGRNGQVSVAAWCTGDSDKREMTGGKVSGDFRFNCFGTDIFGETACDVASGALAAVAGATLPFGEGWKASLLARSYPSGYDGSFSGGVCGWSKTSDERGVAIGLERYGLQMTVDLASKDQDRSIRQCKLLLKIPLQLSGRSVLSFRITERIRPYEVWLKYRTGARADLDWSSVGMSSRYGESDGDAWKARFRVEGLLCRSLAGLTYMEAGRKTGKWSTYLRGTLFLVDNWDDRIYSYERDAPGNFTVPAYYGRGFSLSAVGGCRLLAGNKKTLKVYFRVSTVRYPFMRDPKPSVTEAKLQAVAAI